MSSWTLSKSGMKFNSTSPKNVCNKNRCLKKYSNKCEYCGQFYCEEHIAPLPDEYRNSFDHKGHNCDNFPQNKKVEDIIKKYPYLTKSIHKSEPKHQIFA